MKPVILEELPPGLLDLPANKLTGHLDGPTVIHLAGRNPEPLVVSVLQHGNETSGWEAIRRLLSSRYQHERLPRSLILFIGNVQAAAENVRYLPGQPDLNRCWPGSLGAQTVWHNLCAAITSHIRKFNPFGAIDIHNNTGKNPHYAAVNRIEPRSLQLASAFSRTVVYFTEPRGVQSHAFGQFCPAVTLECGLSSQSDGADHAMAYLEHVLHMDYLPAQFPNPEDLELYQMFATLIIDPQVPFQFKQDEDKNTPSGMICLPAELDHHNFREWPRGFALAQYDGDIAYPLLALGHSGENLTNVCFEMENGQILTKRPLMPAMLTLDPFAIKNDCLCYLMERLSIKALEHGLIHELGHTELPEAIDQ